MFFFVTNSPPVNTISMSNSINNFRRQIIWCSTQLFFVWILYFFFKKSFLFGSKSTKYYLSERNVVFSVFQKYQQSKKLIFYFRYSVGAARSENLRIAHVYNFDIALKKSKQIHKNNFFKAFFLPRQINIDLKQDIYFFDVVKIIIFTVSSS